MNFYDFLQQEGTSLERGRGEHVFRQGEVDQSLYFIKSGLLKAYYLSSEGKEAIKSFLLPNDVIGSLTSAYSEKTCSFSLLCLEPTALIKIPFSVLLSYTKKDQDMANIVIELLLKFSMKKEQREFDFLCLSAEERYRKISETSPILLEKVTQNDLARYLGITPVGLSRIKTRVQK